jgi:hypothetical protein
MCDQDGKKGGKELRRVYAVQDVRNVYDVSTSMLQSYIHLKEARSKAATRWTRTGYEAFPARKSRQVTTKSAIHGRQSSGTGTREGLYGPPGGAERPAEGWGLMEEVCGRPNLVKAYRAVESNGRKPGIPAGTTGASGGETGAGVSGAGEPVRGGIGRIMVYPGRKIFSNI